MDQINHAHDTLYQFTLFPWHYRLSTLPLTYNKALFGESQVTVLRENNRPQLLTTVFTITQLIRATCSSLRVCKFCGIFTSVLYGGNPCWFTAWYFYFQCYECKSLDVWVISSTQLVHLDMSIWTSIYSY